MMPTELELLRTFFTRWEMLHSLGKPKNGRTEEHEAAAQLLVEAAQAVKAFCAPPAIDTSELRSLQNSIADIPPKDGSINAPKTIKWPTH